MAHTSGKYTVGTREWLEAATKRHPKSPSSSSSTPSTPATPAPTTPAPTTPAPTTPKPAKIEAHKKTEDWKLKVGEKFKKGDYWGAAKSWWNKDEPKTPKKRKGDMVKNYARGGGVRPADNEYR